MKLAKNNNENRIKILLQNEHIYCFPYLLKRKLNVVSYSFMKSSLMRTQCVLSVLPGAVTKAEIL